VQVEELHAAAEGADPVGDLEREAARVGELDVDVARGGVAEEVRRRAKTLPRGGEEIHRGVGLDAKELVEIAPIDDQRVEVLDHDRRRGARAAVEEGDLPEELARASGLDDDAIAGVVAEEDLDLAALHDVALGPRITGVEDDRPFGSCW